MSGWEERDPPPEEVIVLAQKFVLLLGDDLQLIMTYLEAMRKGEQQLRPEEMFSYWNSFWSVLCHAHDHLDGTLLYSSGLGPFTHGSKQGFKSSNIREVLDNIEWPEEEASCQADAPHESKE